MSRLIKIKITAHLRVFPPLLKTIKIVIEHVKELWDVCMQDHSLQDRKGPNELIETWTGFVLTFFM